MKINVEQMEAVAQKQQADLIDFKNTLEPKQKERWDKVDEALKILKDTGLPYTLYIGLWGQDCEGNMLNNLPYYFQNLDYLARGEKDIGDFNTQEWNKARDFLTNVHGVFFANLLQCIRESYEELSEDEFTEALPELAMDYIRFSCASYLELIKYQS